ncbi:MAG: STM4012 family radical SAM protein, partial [Propionibacteriaceae bacterium]|nr:STM4012 family radical SAM protein [Propionibacteriaceae bacterium]
AIGGGTPTYLPPTQLTRLLDVFPRVFGRAVADVPTSIETSPATATPDRIALLAEAGVRRISIGIQSMDPAEVHRIGRRQRDDEVRMALDTLRTLGPPVLNIDLMYGLPSQTPDTWLATLRDALRWQPDEVFAYPLYVRPLTGLDHVGAAPTDLRPELYRLGRDLLLAEGYEQTSMRRFRRRGVAEVDDEYACQSDGMVGLGCGARSYTRELHYSREYAVGRSGVKAIIDDYVTLTDADLRVARHGFRLDGDERMRRFVLQSLLHIDGLDVEVCRTETGADPEALPLDQLVADGLATRTDGRVRLTGAGLALSDAIGPMLYSARVADLSRAHDLR